MQFIDTVTAISHINGHPLDLNIIIIIIYNIYIAVRR